MAIRSTVARLDLICRIPPDPIWATLSSEHAKNIRRFWCRAFNADFDSDRNNFVTSEWTRALSGNGLAEGKARHTARGQESMLPPIRLRVRFPYMTCSYCPYRRQNLHFPVC
jgi:hypothetical protein